MRHLVYGVWIKTRGITFLRSSTNTTFVCKILQTRSRRYYRGTSPCGIGIIQPRCHSSCNSFSDEMSNNKNCRSFLYIGLLLRQSHWAPFHGWKKKELAFISKCRAGIDSETRGRIPKIKSRNWAGLKCYLLSFDLPFSGLYIISYHIFRKMPNLNFFLHFRSPRCDGFSGADLGKLVLRAANYRFREFFRLRWTTCQMIMFPFCSWIKIL